MAKKGILNGLKAAALAIGIALGKPKMGAEAPQEFVSDNDDTDREPEQANTDFQGHDPERVVKVVEVAQEHEHRLGLYDPNAGAFDTSNIDFSAGYTSQKPSMNLSLNILRKPVTQIYNSDHGSGIDRQAPGVERVLDHLCLSPELDQAMDELGYTISNAKALGIVGFRNEVKEERVRELNQNLEESDLSPLVYLSVVMQGEEPADLANMTVTDRMKELMKEYQSYPGLTKFFVEGATDYREESVDFKSLEDYMDYITRETESFRYLAEYLVNQGRDNPITVTRSYTPKQRLALIQLSDDLRHVALNQIRPDMIDMFSEMSDDHFKAIGGAWDGNLGTENRDALIDAYAKLSDKQRDRLWKDFGTGAMYALKLYGSAEEAQDLKAVWDEFFKFQSFQLPTVWDESHKELYAKLAGDKGLREQYVSGFFTQMPANTNYDEWMLNAAEGLQVSDNYLTNLQRFRRLGFGRLEGHRLAMLPEAENIEIDAEKVPMIRVWSALGGNQETLIDYLNMSDAAFYAASDAWEYAVKESAQGEFIQGLEANMKTDTVEQWAKYIVAEVNKQVIGGGNYGNQRINMLRVA